MRLLVNALRNFLVQQLPDVTEQLDVPAKMIAYCCGPRYADMVCTIIPSRTGVKLGFYKGNELPDPHSLLKGTGKISRYVEIKEHIIASDALRQLLASARERRKLN